MAKKTVQKTIKVKKKKWYPILAPRTFNESVIGETPATDAESIVGKIVSANLMNLTGDMKKQNINMKFVVTEIKGDHAHTETSRYQMIPALIKQLVRRRRDRIDDSIICKTKDNKIINIKPIILTRSNTKKSIRTRIRLTTNSLIADYLSKNNFEDFMRELIMRRIQRMLKENLNKIYPLRICEIRYVGVIINKEEAVKRLQQQKVIIREEKKELVKEVAEEKKDSEAEPKKEKPAEESKMPVSEEKTPEKENAKTEN